MRPSKQRGYLMFVTILILVVVAVFASALSHLSMNSSKSVTNFQTLAKAEFAAQAGIQDAAHKLLTYNLNYRKKCKALNITNKIPGNSVYNIKTQDLQYTKNPTVLTSNISSDTTIIPVANTAAYANTGRIMIDREFIDYTKSDLENFLEVKRGVDGSIARSHSINTPVAQFTCIMNSIGGMPQIDISDPNSLGSRYKVRQSIQLQAAFAVSDANTPLLGWNFPFETTWSNFSSPTTANLNGISMLSFADGWAVGDNSTIVKWNGNNWINVSKNIPGINFKDVYCLNSKNCHAAGTMLPNSKLVTLADFDGSTWTKVSLPKSENSADLNALHCPPSGRCWAVGDIGEKSSDLYFYNYDGSKWKPEKILKKQNASPPYNGVHCPANNLCFAVGNGQEFLKWNGSTWSKVDTGLPSTQYNNVYCNNIFDCWAVGANVIAHWNGANWSESNSPGSPVLNSVSCTNANDCWAVGDNSTFLHWNGNNWINYNFNSVGNKNINAIAFIGPNTKPLSIWEERFT